MAEAGTHANSQVWFPVSLMDAAVGHGGRLVCAQCPVVKQPADGGTNGRAKHDTTFPASGPTTWVRIAYPRQTVLLRTTTASRIPPCSHTKTSCPKYRGVGEKLHTHLPPPLFVLVPGTKTFCLGKTNGVSATVP
jgi:hypothetical protein